MSTKIVRTRSNDVINERRATANASAKSKIFTEFLSRVSTLTRDTYIAILSVCLSVTLRCKRLNILSQFFYHTV